MHYLRIEVGDNETEKKVDKKFIDGDKEIALFGEESETFAKVVEELIHKMQE